MIPCFLLGKMSWTVTPVYEAPSIQQGWKEGLSIQGPGLGSHIKKVAVLVVMMDLVSVQVQQFLGPFCPVFSAQRTFPKQV